MKVGPKHENIARTVRRRLREQGDGTLEGSRRIRRGASRELRAVPGSTLLDLAELEVARPGGLPRWFVYELLRDRPDALSLVTPERLETLAGELASWEDVDTFACVLAGQCWQIGAIGDEVVHRWAASASRWWRRAALASTVPLNVRAQGGSGDTPRTLAVCRELAGDRDDMVVKALSWALRALAVRDPESVRGFLESHADTLAARVRREVVNKLETGLKNPRGGARSGARLRG